MENEESNLNAGRRGPKNNGVGNYVHSPRSNVILMHFEDFFNLILSGALVLVTTSFHGLTARSSFFIFSAHKKTRTK